MSDPLLKRGVYNKIRGAPHIFPEFANFGLFLKVFCSFFIFTPHTKLI